MCVSLLRKSLPVFLPLVSTFWPNHATLIEIGSNHHIISSKVCLCTGTLRIGIQSVIIWPSDPGAYLFFIICFFLMEQNLWPTSLMWKRKIELFELYLFSLFGKPRLASVIYWDSYEQLRRMAILKHKKDQSIKISSNNNDEIEKWLIIWMSKRD